MANLNDDYVLKATVIPHTSLICHIEEGEPVLTDHEEAKWLYPEELSSVNWLPSDIELIEDLKKLK